MGKVLIEYGFPAVALSLLAIFACKLWFYYFYPGMIEENKKLNRKSKEYDEEMKEGDQ